MSGPGVDPTRQAPAPEVEGATRGGVVTVLSAFGHDTTFGPHTLDPTVAYYNDTQAILSGLVTRSLTQFVYDPDRDAMVLVPDIATDLGTPNADFTEWMYTIRPGVRFEDGTEVTAEDVAYGILRSFDRKAFPTGPSYSNDYFLHGDTYQGPFHTGTVYDGVVVEGDTLTLKMARPFPEMPYWGTFPAMGPIPEGRDLPSEYKLHPLATGPYKFAAYEPFESLTLVQNDQWDPDTDPGRHQYADEYHFDFDTPTKQIESTLLADSADDQTILTLDSLGPSSVRTAESVAADRLLTGPGLCTRFLAPDYREIDQIQVRQALGYAFPYEEVWLASGEVPGVTALPGTSILTPGFPGRLDYNPLSAEPGQTDPDKAREILRQAGYRPGEYEVKMAYVEVDATSVDVSAAIREGLEQGGFKVTLYPQPSWDAYFSIFHDPTSPLNVRLFGWCPDLPTGAFWFPPLTTYSPDSNPAYFHERAVDDEIERIGLLPFDQQAEAWGELDKKIMTEYYPLILTRYDGVAILHGSRVGGLRYDPLHQMPYLKDVYVVP